MIYYHVTFNTRLPKIKQEGLVIGKKRIWSNAFGVKQGDRKAIYLFSDYTMAARWAFRMEWDFKKPVSILVLNCDLSTDNDDHPEAGLNGKTWKKVYENIPASDIIKVIPMSQDIARQLVQANNKNGLLDPPITETLNRMQVLAGIAKPF